MANTLHETKGVFHLKESTPGQRVTFALANASLTDSDIELYTSSNGAVFTEVETLGAELLSNNDFSTSASGTDADGWARYSFNRTPVTVTYDTINNYYIKTVAGAPVLLYQSESAFAGAATINVNSLYRYTYTLSGGGGSGRINARVNFPLLPDGETNYDDGVDNGEKTRDVVASANISPPGVSGAFGIFFADGALGIVGDATTVSLKEVLYDITEITDAVGQAVTGQALYSIGIPEALTQTKGPLLIKVEDVTNSKTTYIHCFIAADPTQVTGSTLTQIRQALTTDHGLGSWVNTIDFSSTDRVTLGAIKTLTDNLPADTDTDMTAIKAVVDATNTVVDTIVERTDNLPNSPAATGAEMDLVNAPNATAITAIQAGLDPIGAGADEVTNNITVEGVPIENMEMWVTTDEAGDNIYAGTKNTDSAGDVLFMLDDGNIYYMWGQKAGVNSIEGEVFVAVAD